MTKVGSLPVTRTPRFSIVLALLAATLSAGWAASEGPKSVVSDAEACERVMSVLAANKVYHAEQMANCGGRDSE